MLLLVDFISVKLSKLEKGSSWSGLGYDIAEFTIPERGQMKSNFLKVAPKPVPVPEPVQAVVEPAEPVEAVPEIELTEEEK